MQCQTCQLAMVKTHNRAEKRERDLRGGVGSPDVYISSSALEEMGEAVGYF